MATISLSGLDLSFLQSGGGPRGPRPPRPPRRSRSPQVASGNGAVVIDFDTARVKLRGPASKKMKAAAAAIAATAKARKAKAKAQRAKRSPRPH